jgi:ribosomal protein L18E
MYILIYKKANNNNKNTIFKTILNSMKQKSHNYKEVALLNE